MDGNITRPDKEVLDTMEMRCAWRMMVRRFCRCLGTLC